MDDLVGRRYGGVCGDVGGRRFDERRWVFWNGRFVIGLGVSPMGGGKLGCRSLVWYGTVSSFEVRDWLVGGFYFYSVRLIL